MLSVIKYAPADLKLTVVTTLLTADAAAEWKMLVVLQGRLLACCLNNPDVVLELSEEDTANDVISFSGTAKYIWSGAQI